MQATSCQRRTEPRRTTARNIRFLVEQINIALEQKGSGNFSAWVIEACRPETNVRKESIYIN